MNGKALLARILERFKTEQFIGDYTARARQINSSLTTSSTDDAWLKAAIAAICEDYPGMELCIFKGQLGPNSQGYFEICIYNTSVTSGGLPRYCYGTWRKWQNAFWIIFTSEYVFSYEAK